MSINTASILLVPSESSPLSPSMPPPRSPRYDFTRLERDRSSSTSGRSSMEGDRSHRSASISSQGPIGSSGVQSRRTGVSLGLGVSFAEDDSPSNHYSSHNHSTNVMLSRPASRSHSRRSSLINPLGSSSNLDMNSSGSTTTSTSSQHPSRRPSISHLASFLSGIEHHTRVRNPGVTGGRGVSRSASRSQSRAGEHRRSHERQSSLDEDGVEILSYGGRMSHSSTYGSRASSIAPRSRRSSINGVPIGYGYPPNSSGGNSGSGNEGLERSVGSLWEEEERGTVMEESEASFKTPLQQSPQAQQVPLPRIFHPPSTPRMYSTETEEEPFLDTAPSSPQPRRTRTHDSFSNGLEEVDVFDEGERVGVGVWLEGRGGWARDCFGDTADEVPGNGIGGPGELEVVRRLGEGTYAIVYLVREVLFDPQHEEDDDALSPIDAFASFHFDDASDITSSRPKLTSWASDPFAPPPEPVYGKYFALKCLCKKDLTDELIEVQRGEAVLHRALPDHEYIVRLYGAFETDDWLFLVLEYCPGQDLFYFLSERQDDSVALYDPHSGTASPLANPIAMIADSDDEGLLSRTVTSHHGDSDRTPPSPSLLSTTLNSSLLSRRRLRLISRMFGQMCSAVQVCHEAGIAHRDIKPENFIVSDGRSEGESGMARVVVKITDWGLGTTETACEDFDCGSKPYMAYECRNNLQPTYDPRQADVWSLGLVLLNLLYHRNPWSDPALEDPDFADYVKDPVGFLQDRFEGIGEEVATFLSDRVFCDVLEMEGDAMRRRVSAGEFGRWAGRLVMMMGEGKRKRASVSDHTFQLFSSPSRALPRSPLQAPQSGLLSQFAPQTLSPQNMEDSPLDLREETLAKVDEGEEDKLLPLHFPPITNRPNPIPMYAASGFDSPLPSPTFHPVTLQLPPPASPVRPTLIDSTTEVSSVHLVDTEGNIDDRERGEGAGAVKCWGEPDTQNPKLKRRKRGARKGGKAITTPGEVSPSTPAPLSPASPLVPPTEMSERDRVLDDLAMASQELARELSKSIRTTGARSTGTRSTGTQSTSALSSSSASKSATIIDSNKKNKPSSGGVLGKMRSLVKDGNPDLLAFKQRVEERNLAIGAKADTYSAPAKMQGISKGTYSATSTRSRGSNSGMNSWSEHSALGEGGDEYRGRSSGGGGGGEAGSSADPWSSASSRRDRLGKHHRIPSPSSSTTRKTLSTTSASAVGGGGFDSRNHTPLSSFSSSGHSAEGGRGDWRQPSPQARGGRPPPPPTLLSPTSHPKANGVVMKEMSTDTFDLGHFVASPSASATIRSSPSPASAGGGAGGGLLPSLPLSLSQPKTTTSLSSSASTTLPPSLTKEKEKEVPVKVNKLAKMLNSISVFNRGQGQGQGAEKHD